jgi:DNA polymerase-3 subunit epsilon
MKPMRFAVVDVETTGGYAGAHRVTEVGIAISNGQRVIDTYHTLINPEKVIPHHITVLTGIDDAMVMEAPRFEEKADEIEALLADSVFVAHNVNFDYSFIRGELARLGRNLRSRKLCTARYARSLLPDQHGFSLNKLARRFGIVNQQPHRALSDAITAAEILHKLLALDGEGMVTKKISRLEREVKLPLYLPPDKFHSISNVPGVYYMYGSGKNPIYIGKAKKLKQRIAQHFQHSDAARTQAFMREVTRLETKPMGTELMAYIREDVDIRKYWPKHNRAQKQINMGFHIVPYQDHEGILRIGIKRGRHFHDALVTFQSMRAAMVWLHQQVEAFQLNPEWCGLGQGWQHYACPEKEEHNAKTASLIQSLQYSKPDEIIRLKGRNSRERAFIWLRQKQVYAIGFAPLEIDWDDHEQLNAHSETVFPSSRINQLAMSYQLMHSDMDSYQI